MYLRVNLCRVLVRLLIYVMWAYDVLCTKIILFIVYIAIIILQVILSGDPSSRVMQELVRVVHNFPNPNRILLVATPDANAPLYTHHPTLHNYRKSASADAKNLKKGKKSKTEPSTSVKDHASGDGLRKSKEESKTPSTTEDVANKRDDYDEASSSSDEEDSSRVTEFARAYVCHDFVCSLPMTKPEQLKENLKKAFQQSAGKSSRSD